MNTVHGMLALIGLTLYANLSFSMGSDLGSHFSCGEAQMAQFSYSLNALATDLTDLSRQQIGYRGSINISPLSSALTVNLEKIGAMQRNIKALRASLSPESSIENTDVLLEVQAVFDHLDERLIYVQKLLHTYNATPLYQRGTLLHKVLNPLVEMQADLNGLFGICGYHRYVSPHNNTIIQVLLAKARSFFITKSLILAQSLVDPDDDIIAAMDNDKKNLTWFESMHKGVQEYEVLYEKRARIAIDLAKKDPKHITSVFADLSHRLCGTAFCRYTNENLDLLERLCAKCSALKPKLQEMKKDNDLTADNMAKILNAAMPHVVSSGLILGGVEAIVVTADKPTDGVTGGFKKAASQMIVQGIKQLGVADDKKLDSLRKNAINGTPFSQAMHDMTDTIKQFHVEGMIPTVVALLKAFDPIITIMMGRVADACINGEPTCAKILKIVHDLKGGNVSITRECNRSLINYLKSLKNSWENPMTASVIERPFAPSDTEIVGLSGSGSAVSSEGWETASDGSDYHSAWDGEDRDEDLSDLPVQADFDVTYASGVNGIANILDSGVGLFYEGESSTGAAAIASNDYDLAFARALSDEGGQ